MNARQTRSGRRRAAQVGMVTLAAALTVGLSGCVGMPVDDGFKTAIPEALSSTLGYTDAWAGKGIDGFTDYLSVGFTVPDESFDSDDLKKSVAIVLQNSTFRPDSVRLSIDTTEEIDLVALAEQAGAEHPYGDSDRLILDIKDAEVLADAAE